MASLSGGIPRAHSDAPQAAQVSFRPPSRPRRRVQKLSGSNLCFPRQASRGRTLRMQGKDRHQRIQTTRLRGRRCWSGTCCFISSATASRAPTTTSKMMVVETVIAVSSATSALRQPSRKTSVGLSVMHAERGGRRTWKQRVRLSRTYPPTFGVRAAVQGQLPPRMCCHEILR